MYVFLRLLLVFLRSRRAPRHEPDAKITTPLRVWFNDLDINFHLNNGRYLTLADLGRFDLTMKTGMLAVMRREKWYPVLATGSIKFRRSLEPLQSFELTTQIVYWDEKWFYILHEFVRGGDVCARALVKGVFRGPGGNVKVAQIMAKLGVERQAPVMPPMVESWLAFEKGAPLMAKKSDSVKVYGYKNCSTCQKAYKFLKARDLAFDEIDITTKAPSLPELKAMLARYDGQVKKLFNTSGQAYRDGKVGEALKDMSDTRALAMLAGNGRLVKRPFLLVAGQASAVGFKEDEWQDLV